MNIYIMNIWISIFVQMKKIFLMSQPTEKDIESIKVIQKIVKGVHNSFKMGKKIKLFMLYFIW